MLPVALYDPSGHTGSLLSVQWLLFESFLDGWTVREKETSVWKEFNTSKISICREVYISQVKLDKSIKESTIVKQKTHQVISEK